MTGARKGNSTSPTKREQMALPKWLPPAVEKQVRQIEEQVRQIEEQNLPIEQLAILRRLATDVPARSLSFLG